MEKTVLLIAAFIAVVIYVVIDNQRKARQKMLNKIKKNWAKPSKRKYSEDEYELISHYFKEKCSGENCIDDITWNDLNMDEIFKQMNIANSSAGQEYLYYQLRTPKTDKKELDERNRLVKYFDSNEKERVELQKEFFNLGFAKYLSLSDYIGIIVNAEKGGNAVHYFMMLFIIAAFAVCIGINPVIGIGLIIVSITLSIISYYKSKAKVEQYFICIIKVVAMTKLAENIATKKYKSLEKYSERLMKLCKEFDIVTKNAWLIQSGNINGSLTEMLLDYLRMLTHIDLIKYNKMVKHIADRQEQIYELYELLGLIEAQISVASFRNTLEYWSEPDLDSSYRKMELNSGFHPLVKNPVSNSIVADSHILLTGSNASGKSTFLRTVAINALLSQTIYTSVSKQYRAPFYRIYSSMSLKDSIKNSDSYYIVEIKSLKRILDAVNDNEAPVLCFVDEVLRGTNTVERIAASSQILKYLKNKNVLCFAATHDIELTAILKDCYENYHFQEEVTDNDIHFNFKLYKGPATTRNAIKLLNIIGYDKKITQGAEKQAGYFIENGIWEMQ